MADLKARLLKVAKTLMWGIAWSRMLQKPSVSQKKTPVGFSESWFSSVAGTARKNSIRSMGIWLVVSCLPALPRSLLCLTTTIPTEHADRPLCCLPRSRSTRPFFSPGIGTLRGAASNQLNFLYFSQQRSASQNPNLIFFKCCVNEILECAPFCSDPSSSNDMTICCVFHYNLADGNILFHVNINKGRFDLAQKFQIKRGNFYFKVQEGNLLFCAETY